jgi:DNA mismatch repair protein MutS2
MSSVAEQVLEFAQVVAILRAHVASPLGAARLERLRPLADRAEAEQELAEVAEARDWLRESADEKPPVSFGGLHDVGPAVARLTMEGAALEPLDLFHLLELLERASDARLTLAASHLKFPRLAALADQIAEFRPLLRELTGKILPNGQLDDHASAALRRIRRDIDQQKRAVLDSLERFVRAHSEEGTLQEDYVTIRNERLVVPVKVGQKRRIEGVIHAASSSGQTLFVEPLETIELNNQLVRLAEEEAREVERILREMTGRLAGYAEAIRTALETMAGLEVLFARGSFALAFDATIPRFSPPEGPRLRLRSARHPLLENLLRRKGQQAVPATLDLDAAHRVLIISGPNTGGKTVALKTVGLLALMAQAGLPVPAQEAEFPWFDQVLADIGDAQSIHDSLSTFSAHVTALREMMASVQPGSLVLLDELGAATDPQEGGALGVAVVEHFRLAGAFTLVSTHLPALKSYGAHTDGVLSASVGFDEQSLSPNYHLTVGLPGQSAGLEIAQRLGLPASIIAQARKNLTRQDLEAAALVRELHRRKEEYAAAQSALDAERSRLERRQKEVEREWEKRETAKLKELERRLDVSLDKFHSEARATLDRLAAGEMGKRAAADASRRVAKVAREAREDFETTVLSTLDEARQGVVTSPLTQVAEGALVRLRGVTTPARVRRRLGADRLEVEAGLIKMQVSLDDVLEVVAGGAVRPSLPDHITVQTAPRHEPVTEINVIGATAEEARDRVDKFLDTAVLAGAGRVRVIHGHGMGVLRKTLWQMFASHPHVARYYQAEQQEGGAGATIVELRLE